MESGLTHLNVCFPLSGQFASPMNAKQIAQSDTTLIADVTPDEAR